MARTLRIGKQAYASGRPVLGNWANGADKIGLRHRMVLATALCGVMALPGCRMEDQLMSEPQAGEKAIAAPEVSTDVDRLGKGCELKNVDGTGSCEDGRNPQNPKPTVAAATGRFDPADREKQGFAAVGMVNALFYSGQLGAFQDFCKTLEAAPAAAPLPQSSRPTAQKGGGCEWRGSSYAPGDTIYHSEGPILSQDLFINGQSFDHFTGKPGPWQMCECQVSVGHWGCV